MKSNTRPRILTDAASQSPYLLSESCQLLLQHDKAPVIISHQCSVAQFIVRRGLLVSGLRRAAGADVELPARFN